MQAGGLGSIVSLSFQASQRVFPNYNVMGSAKAALEHATRQLAYELGPMDIRVNTISAGPRGDALGAGISGFTQMAKHHEKMSPLKRNIEPREVGDAAAVPLLVHGLGDHRNDASTSIPAATSWACNEGAVPQSLRGCEATRRAFSARVGAASRTPCASA